MTTNPFTSGPTFLRFFHCVSLALLLGGAARLPAQDFSITGAYLRADGRIVLEYPAYADAYYVLYHGPLTNLTQAVDVTLGVNGTGELVGGDMATNGPDGFFRILQVPATQPLDSDGDGWNDVDEITVGSDPLDPRSRPSMMVVSAPPVSVVLPAHVPPCLSNNTVVASPPVAMVLPANEGPSALALNTTMAMPPVALLLPASEGTGVLALNTTVASPPVALVLPANEGPGGLSLNTTVALPPVALVPAQDNDEDGVPDALERFMGLDPTKKDSFGDGISDGDRDFDLDGLSNAREIVLGTQPMRADSDSDGWNDETEATAGSDPFAPGSRPFQMVLSSPPAAFVLPMDQGTGGLALNTTAANPPVALLLSANEGPGALGLNATVAWPPVALLLPADQGVTGLTNNTVIAQPPVRLQIEGQ